MSDFSFVEKHGGAPVSNGKPLLLQKTTAHARMLERYKNRTGTKPVKALQRKNFSDYQRMLYWLDYSIASLKKDMDQADQAETELDSQDSEEPETPEYDI